MLCTLLALAGVADAAPAPKLLDAQVRLADTTESAQRLGTRDSFVQALSPFDRAARLKSDHAITEREYLRFVAAQALPFSEAERDLVLTAIVKLDAKLTQLHRSLPLPKEVVIIKTTGAEEGNAPYCRGNAIVIPRTSLHGEKLDGLLAHELFHISSRQDEATRKKLYALIGFTPIAEVALPEALRARKITNPDGYHNDFKIRVTLGDRIEDALPVLIAKSAYDAHAGDEFFAYLTFKLLLVRTGEIVDAPPSYFAQLGDNTGYTIHPDEVLADNFASLVAGGKVATPALLSRMLAAWPPRK